MTIEQIYVAFDGSKFDTEDECKYYESLRDKSLFTMLDSNKKATENLNGCYYVLLKDDKAVEAFLAMSEDEGLCIDGIDHSGSYCWDDNEEIWISLENKIAELNELIGVLKSLQQWNV